MTSPLAQQLATRPPRRILLVSTLRLGDLLLTTPLLRSIKRHWPQAELSVLTLPGHAGLLEGNPDVDAVLLTRRGAGKAEQWALLRQIWRRYDLAVSSVAADRAHAFCLLGGRRQAGFINPDRSAWLRRHWLDVALPVDDERVHAIDMGLQLADQLGVPRAYPVVAPTAGRTFPAWQAAAAAGRLAVLHPAPMFRYKAWPEAGWIALASTLRAQGWTVLLSGAPEDAASCRQLAAASGSHSIAGQLRLAELADLLRIANLAVAPDTVVAHLAAACGTPSVALFGPSWPVKWGPWPQDWQRPGSPWPARLPAPGYLQRGNVVLLQGSDAAACVPCRAEGCQQHINSPSRCLENLPVAQVLAAIAHITRPSGGGSDV